MEKILMVCPGNICRSPLAEGIMLKLIEEQKLDMMVDSAGTSIGGESEQCYLPVATTAPNPDYDAITRCFLPALYDCYASIRF